MPPCFPNFSYSYTCSVLDSASVVDSDCIMITRAQLRMPLSRTAHFLMCPNNTHTELTHLHPASSSCTSQRRLFWLPNVHFFTKWLFFAETVSTLFHTVHQPLTVWWIYSTPCLQAPTVTLIYYRKVQDAILKFCKLHLFIWQMLSSKVTYK